MSDLPPGWSSIAVRDAAAPFPGSLTDGPFGSNLKTEHYVQQPGARVIRLQNIGDLTFNGDDEAFIAEQHYVSLRKHDVHPGDVLIAGMGDVLPRVCLAPQGIEPAIVKADCFRLRCREGIDSRFVQYALSTPQVRRAASTSISGVGRPRLNLGKIGSLTIPLPPTAEQERIVAAIEEEFSRLDAGVGALKRLRRNLKRMELSVLSKMRDGPWERVPFGDLVENHDGKRVPVKAALRRPGPYPYYGAQGVIDHVDEFIFDGDFVLIAEDGANLTSRVLPIAMEARGQFWVNNHAHVVIPHDDVLPEYLTAVLNADPLAGAITGTAQPKLPQKALNRLLIPKPPITEQEALVKYLSDADIARERTAEALVAVELRAKALRSSILAAAFSGKLVRQNPSDEPVLVLLERIGADRASSNGRKPREIRKPRANKQKVPV
jgi:type I restriction enzyme S subunit